MESSHQHAVGVSAELKFAVTADDEGSHFRRDRRYPGTHPLVPARFFALSFRRETRAWRDALAA